MDLIVVRDSGDYFFAIFNKNIRKKKCKDCHSIFIAEQLTLNFCPPACTGPVHPSEAKAFCSAIVKHPVI